MSRVDVVRLVEEGQCRYQWHWITSSHENMHLRIAVMRDAMKFDAMPKLDWFRRIQSTESEFDGIRLPASADELQRIADLVGGMLMTPRVVDLIWLQAALKFNPVINNGNPVPDLKYVATMDIHDVHQRIENRIKKLGGDDGSQLVSCVGKYWVLINELSGKGMIEGDWTACNYGWCSTFTNKVGLTEGVTCYQRPGYQHNKQHLDPSQTIRLMYKTAALSRDDGASYESVNLLDVAQHPDTAMLVTHDGRPLSYTRQQGVPVVAESGHVVLPPVIVNAEVDL